MTPGPIAPIGWLHTAACTVALIAGAIQITSAKRTPAHPLRGSVYFWSTVIAYGTTLFLFSVDVVVRRGEKPLIGPYFGVFHWLAMFTLLLVVLGRVTAKRQDKAFSAYAHPIFMIVSYWLLVGGAINEAFGRLGWLQELALRISPTARTPFEYHLLHWFQYANHTVALVALVAAISGVRRWRRAASQLVCT